MKIVVNIFSLIFIVSTISCSSNETLVDYKKIDLIKIDSTYLTKQLIRSEVETNYKIIRNGCIPILPKFEISVINFEILDINKKIISAKPIGGKDAITVKIVYPELAKRARIEGNVICEFKVDKNGNAMDIKILKDIGGGCGEGVLDSILKSKFIPGMKLKNKIESKYRIAIQFKILPVNNEE